MGDVLSLNSICIGESARVMKLQTEEYMKRRFLDIGLTEGTVIKCVGKSPWGDPAAFQIRGAVIALRRSDCEGVKVCRVGDRE